MNNKKKQTAVVAMATVLSVTSIASPMAVMAQEDTPVPPAIVQEEMGQQKTAPEIVLPENLQATAGTALEEITLLEHWAWVEKSTVITAETAEYPARFSVDDVTYDYSNVEGYNAEGHYVERMVVITVEPEKSEPVKPEQAEVVQENSRMLKEDTPTTFTAGDIEINEDNFPDKGFRDWLKAQPYGKDETIDKTEIAGITEIHVNGNANIKDLTGIEHFTALTNLLCAGTGITSLDVSNNEALTFLDCSDTGITSLNVSNNTALSNLFCYNTGITSLDVSTNKALKILACSDTPLAYLNIGDNTWLTVSKRNLKNPTIYVTTNTFMFTDIFSGIDITKISNLNGADLDNATGEVSNYIFGTPITYEYACGTSNNGEETLTVELTVTNNLPINADNFPDKTFRAYITDNFDTDKNGYLSTTEIAGITEIDVSVNRNIQDLTGIEYFTALTRLLCYRIGITSLDVSNNKALTELRCYNTGITHLDVSNNKALKELVCYNTGITSLDVSNNKELTYLNCYGTGITSLDVSNNKELTYLSCFGTGITSLDVSNNKALTELDCHGIGITSLDVSNNKKLTELDCGDTGITSLNVSNNKKLTFLDCSGTGITSLDVSNNTALEKLYCQDTGITSLDVSNNMALTSLNCSRTPLAYLNIGINNKLTNLNKGNLKSINVEVTGDSFNMADKYPGIKVDKISNVKGADYNNGVMSNYNVGTPITYTYDCGTSNNGAETIDVTMNLTGSFISVTDDMNKTYDGIAVNASPTVRKSGSTGAVSYRWEQKKNATDWEDIASAPTDAGTYRVTATLASDNNYPEATSAPVEFTISQATNGWTENLAIKGWTYGEKANTPTAKASFGDVVFTYSNSKNGTYTDKVPTNAGTWYVKATVTTDNYKTLESVEEFVIAQATNSWTENLALKGWTYGEKANTPTAKASFGDVAFTYSNSKDGTYTDKVPTNAGTWYVKATVTTDNYKTLESLLAFTIAPKSADNNSQITIPSINSDKDVENLVIKDGDKVLEKGTDYEVAKTQDGNKVTVTITFKGNYTGTVTRSYTVEEKTPAGGDKDDNKSNGTKTDNQNTDDKKSVQTGDNSKIGLLATMSLLSAGFIAFLTGKKRKNIKDN